MDKNDENSSISSLDEILVTLGFLPIDIYIYEIVMPIVASLGLLLCIISVRILFNKIFTTFTYDYYRIITISYIIQLMFAIPYGMCFTPFYFPDMNSHSCAIVQCIYIPYSSFTSNFAAILEIAVLLEGIKIMNLFVKRHFTITSRKMILISFLTTLILNAIYGMVYVPFYAGDFYYYNSNMTFAKNSLWYVSSSSLATSHIGSIVLLIFYFIRDIFTMAIAFFLNIFSLYEMKKYLKIQSSILNQSLPALSLPKASNLTFNVISQTRRKSEKNAIKLILTRCFISTITRCVIVLCDVYYLFSTDYIATLIGAISDLVLVVGPTFSFFVFYHFNRDFRKEFEKMCSKAHEKFKEIYID
jgi:hypothetical protein